MKARIYWEFIKSTLVINWLFSFVCAFVLPQPFVRILPIAITTAGALVSIFYQEISRQKEYYFYYNQGISKFNLLLVTMLFNILTATLLFLTISNG